MSPTEILASESQERMLLIVAPDNLDRVLQVAGKWGVWATAIGEVTGSETPGQPGRLVISWNDHVVVDVPPGSLADDGPVYARPIREPGDLILLQADRAETLPRPSTPDELRATVLRMAASPNLCDKGWVTEQYDRYVLGNTVLAQPEDAGVLRVDERTGLGVALSVDGNGRFARLDPYEGARLALAEAYRNVAVTGAEPAAVTDCLNFGSPEDPAVMWQFAEAVRGLADGCQELGIPVTGGNVSFYNQTGAAAIHPTPVVGVLGILDDVARRVPIGFPPPPNADGDLLFLLGDTACELSGSEWAWVVHQHLGGRPPKANLAGEKALAGLLASASQRGHINAAHDLSDGGLAQVLVESCLRRNIGARILLPDGEAFVYLFSESTGRALVAVPRGHEKAFAGLAAEHGVSCTAIGVTAQEPALEVLNQFTIPLDELRAAFTATMRQLFGGPGELANRHGDREHVIRPDEPGSLLIPEAAAGTPTSDVGSPTVATHAAPPTAFEGDEPVTSVTLELTQSHSRAAAPSEVSRDDAGSAVYTSSARAETAPTTSAEEDAAAQAVEGDAPAGLVENDVPPAAVDGDVPVAAAEDDGVPVGVADDEAPASTPDDVAAVGDPDEDAADMPVAAIDDDAPLPGGPIAPEPEEAAEAPQKASDQGNAAES
jgi:selenophosphate synthetase-related protein